MSVREAKFHEKNLHVFCLVLVYNDKKIFLLTIFSVNNIF